MKLSLKISTIESLFIHSYSPRIVLLQPQAMNGTAFLDDGESAWVGLKVSKIRSAVSVSLCSIYSSLGQPGQLSFLPAYSALAIYDESHLKIGNRKRKMEGAHCASRNYEVISWSNSGKKAVQVVVAERSEKPGRLHQEAGRSGEKLRVGIEAKFRMGAQE